MPRRPAPPPRDGRPPTDRPATAHRTDRDRTSDARPPDRADDGPEPDTTTRRGRTTAGETRGGRADADEARRIDETLTRLSAAHAGVTLADPGRDAPEPEPPAPPKPPRRLGVLAGRVVVAAVALLVFVATAFQYVGVSRLDAAVRQVAALDPDSGAIVDAAEQEGAENVLFLGTDPGAAATGGPRSDTVLLAHVPASGGRVAALAIPRDLEVARPPCSRWDASTGTYLDEVVPAEARTPLVSAFDLGGPLCATRVVQQLTGLAVTRFVALDLDRVGDLVDAVQGVDVCVERPVVDGLLGTVVPTAGTSRIDGRQAVDLLQARTVDGEAGWRGSTERQQRLVAAVLGEVLSSDVLLDPARIGAVGPALGAALSTDGADLARILTISRSLRVLDADGVAFSVVPTAEGTSSLGNAVLRDADARELFAALRSDAPLPAQSVLASSTAQAPLDVPVDVANASDRQGLATQIGDTLTGLGFRVGAVGNAPAPTDQTVIRFSPDRAAAADRLAETIPSATSVPDPGTSGVLQLVLGRSFDGVVRAVSDGIGDPAAVGAPDVSCR